MIKPALDQLVHRTAMLPRIDGGRPTQNLIKAGSLSELRRGLRRVAAADCPAMSPSFELRPDCLYLHLVSVGSGEHYSCNENADFFNEHPRSWRLIEPKKKITSVLELGPGLAETHDTFLQHGGVFRNHQDKLHNNMPSLGEIPWAGYNDDMHRGELVVELPQDEWSKEIELFDKGEPLLWSQGSGCPEEICGVCGHTVTRDKPQHCLHIRFYQLVVRGDGVQVMKLCPNSIFFDISNVGNNPAEKIAFGLRRVAGTSLDPDTAGWSMIAPPAETVEQARSVSPSVPAFPASTLHRLSAAEKKVSSRQQVAIPGISAEQYREIGAFVREKGLNDAVPLLTRAGIILTPCQFHAIVRQDGEPNGVSGYLKALRSVYKQAEADADEFRSDAVFRTMKTALPHRDVSRAASLTGGKTVHTLPVRQASVLEMDASPTVQDRYTARMYAQYQAMYMDTHRGAHRLADLCAAMNAAGI